jgi:hypothetical protein
LGYPEIIHQTRTLNTRNLGLIAGPTPQLQITERLITVFIKVSKAQKQFMSLMENHIAATIGLLRLYIF